MDQSGGGEKITMHIAIISDIHGNLIALETVLADIRSANVNRIVCLGDVAASGPQPQAVITLLRTLKIPCVMGNADEELFNPHVFEANSELRQRIKAISQWNAAQLSSADLDFLRAFQPTITIPLDEDASLLCYHGSPRSNNDVILVATPDEELEPMVAGFTAAALAGGHTHTQMLRRYQDKLIINTGSVGLPFERVGTEIRNVPWAEYALLHYETGNLRIEFRRVSLDVHAITHAALASGMPHAEWWISTWHGPTDPKGWRPYA